MRRPVAACRSTPGWRILALMGTKSRQSIYGSSVRHSAERAAEARKEADRLAVVAWNQRMLSFKGPAQPSPSLGDALNAGFLYLEVSVASVVTPIKPWRSTLFAGRRRRPSTNWNVTCAAKTVRRFAATPISAAILSRCGPRKFQPSIRHRPGGRASDDRLPPC
jgi:hypothetical protein